MLLSNLSIATMVGGYGLVEKGAVLARLDNAMALEGAVLTAEANLAVREAALMQTRAAVEASRDEAQASLDQAVATAAEAAARICSAGESPNRWTVSTSTPSLRATAASFWKTFSAALAQSRL